MLKQRVITALVLLPVVLFVLFASNSLYWRLFIVLVIGLGLYEWLGLARLRKWSFALVSYCVMGALFYGLLLLPVGYCLSVALLIWCGLFYYIFYDKPSFLANKWVKLWLGVLILSCCGNLLLRVHDLSNGVAWILLFFLSIWAMDVGAYFSGKRFGLTKLAPSISPGKTVEGLIGGLVLSCVLSAVVLVMYFQPKLLFSALFFLFLTALSSVAGDLYESKLKRAVGLKDSSQLLPGHGGVLDRIDSVLAGLPFFCLGLFYLGVLQ